MAGNYTVKINRRDGAIEVSGDREWVDEKLAELADVYSASAIETPNRDQKPNRQPPRQRRKSKTTGDDVEKTPRRRSGSPSRVKGLDLAPKGKKSFEAFVAEKQPRTQDDKNAVSVYYLSEIAQITPVTMEHVYTCYRDRAWAVPTDVANSLQVTASRKGFIDTTDMDDIRLEPRGTNYVEHSLPVKKDS